MARKRRTAKVSTIRQNISHLRKMISRLEAMKLQAPPTNMKMPKVKRFGSRLIVDGKKYKPADLDKLKGRSVSWQQPVLADLERKLAKEQYRLIQKGKSPRKAEALSKLEQEQAEQGYDMITTPEEIEFAGWLNSGSDGIKKAYYYHIYGASTINRGDIRGFMQYMEIESGQPIKKVSDLRGIFKD